MMPELKWIKIEDIYIPPERARSTMTEEQFRELVASIKAHGFTDPILVAPYDEKPYILIDGEHRIKAALEAGLDKVLAVVIEADEKKRHLLNILSNTARGTQNPMDVAEALKRALEAGATEEELAAATGHDIRWVRFYLTLNDLPDEYKEALRSGKLKVGHIKECMRLMEPVEIDACLQSVLVHDWTVSVTKYYVEQRLATIREYQERGEIENLEPPPSPEKAQEIVMYGECMVCHRKVPRNQLSMPTICDDCRTLLEYIVSQLGDPREALQTIYNALSMYFDMLRQQKRAQTQPVFRVQPQSQGVPAGTQGEEGVDQELLDLARKLMLLKKAGLL